MDVEEQLEERDAVFSTGVGVLLGIAAFELLPEALGEGPGVLVGAVAVFAFFLWFRWETEREELTGVVLIGFFVHAALEGAFTATAFAAGTATGVAAVVGLVLHELPEFAAVAAVFTGMGRSLRDVGKYQATAIGLVVVSFVAVFFLLDRLPHAVVAVGLGAASGAFALLGVWDAGEILRDRDWPRAAAFAVGVLAVGALARTGVL